jgi:acetyltransferase-like isoleucine patch superfamily enzyme
LTDQTVTLQEAFAIAVDRRQAGDLGESETILRQILELLPQNPTALHELSIVLSARGDHAAALDAVLSSIDADPTQSAFHATLGEVLAALGRPADAVDAFRRSFTLRGEQQPEPNVPSPARPFSATRLRDAIVVAANELLVGFGCQRTPLTFHDLVQLPRVWKYQMLSDCERVTGDPIARQPVLLKGRGEIRFGREVQFGWHASPHHYSGYSYVEAGLPESVVEIADGTLFNNSAVVRSEGPGIRIGANALFGTNVEIFDSDFHDLHPARRRSGVPATAAVEIGDNVFTGSDVKILKGVTIGANTIVGNGSIVTSDLPADVIAVGTPARVLREL